jgi:signal peptidase II
LKVLYYSLFVIIFDQVTKFLIKGIRIPALGINFNGMPYGSSKPVIGEVIKFTFIENPGMAFGLDVGPKMFLTLFTIVASFVILYYIYKHRNDGFLLRLSLAFILAGAVGNLIDRTFYGKIYGYAPLFYGKVVDFVQVQFWDFTIFGKTYTTWPIFNVADVSVSVGFLIILLFHKRIFKSSDELPVVINHENALVHIPGTDNPGNLQNPTNEIDKPGLNPGLNSKLNTQVKVEDTKENGVPGPGGTKENKD